MPKFFGNIPKISGISAGGKHSAMVTDDNQLLVTGCNKDGQLGLGNNINSSRPVLNNYVIDKVGIVACGTSHTLTLTKTGKLFGFGLNDKGQLGCSSRKASNIPLPIIGYDGNCKIERLEAGNFSGYLDESGKLYLWGLGTEDTVNPIKQEFDMKIKGLSLWKDNCVIIDERGRVLT